MVSTRQYAPLTRLSASTRFGLLLEISTQLFLSVCSCVCVARHNLLANLIQGSNEQCLVFRGKLECEIPGDYVEENNYLVQAYRANIPKKKKENMFDDQSRVIMMIRRGNTVKYDIR